MAEKKLKDTINIISISMQYRVMNSMFLMELLLWPLDITKLGLSH